MTSSDFKIKFDGEQHQIEANVLINSLIHVTTIIQEVNKSIDPTKKIEIKVKAPEKGSFLIHLEIFNPDAISAIRDLLSRDNMEYAQWVVVTLVGLFQLKKLLKSEKPAAVDKSGKQTKIESKSGDVIYIDSLTFNIYEKNDVVQDALTQHFETISNEPSITGLELLDKDEKPLIRIDREEFGELSSKPAELKDGERIDTERTALNIVRLSFEKNLKWEFYNRGIKITAKINDPSFYERIDKGESFSKGDTLEVDLKITKKWDEAVKTWVNKSYEVAVIHRHISRDNNQTGLPL